MSASKAPDASRRIRARHRQPFGRMALRRRGDEQLQPAGDAGDREDRRARQVRPVLHLRRAGDGPGRPSVVRQPVRADDAAGGAQHGHAPYRARRDRVHELQRAVQRRAQLCVARPSQRRPRGVERRDQHAQCAAALNFSRERLSETTCATKSRPSSSTWCADCGTPGTTGRSWPTNRRGAFLDKSKVRPLDHKGRFFNVKGPLNIERCPQGHPSSSRPAARRRGQELSARSADLVSPWSTATQTSPRRPMAA